MENGKKYLAFILALMLIVAVAFTLVCCNKKNTDSQQQGDKPIEDNPEITISVTIDDDYQVREDGSLYCVVPNDKKSYSLKGAMYVASDVELKYYISNNGSSLDEEIKDIEGILIEEGNNFIIAVLKQGNVTNRYKFVIYRKMRFTVTFDTPTQEVEPQVIVEDACAIEPKVIPTRLGYAFVKWDYNFARPITSDTVIKAIWAPREYVITYDPNGGEMEQTTQTVLFGENVTFLVPTREGYQFKGWYIENSKQQEGEWKIDKDVEFVAKWDILSLNVSVTPSLAAAGEISGENKYEYDSVCTLQATPYLGYRFNGWYDENDNLKSSNAKYVFVVGSAPVNLVAKFSTLVPEMAQFMFKTEDEESYVITGVRNANISEIVVPDCVVGIQNNCLGVTALRSLTIPFIGTCAENAKYMNPLKSLFVKDVPKTLTYLHITGECYIDDGTFSGATFLETIVLDDARYIGDSAFYSCKYLTDLKISDSVEYVGKHILYSTSSADGYYPMFYRMNEYDNGYYVGNDDNPYLVFIREKELFKDSCVINENTKIIAGYAFNATESYLNGLTLNVTLPSNIKFIGDRAFYKRAMTSINFPTALKYIGDYAFYDAFDGDDIDLTFNGNLETIGNCAFSSCTAIKSVVFPDSLTKLGANAFEDCWMSSVTFGKGLKTIPEHAFYNNYINDIVIPDNIENIENYSFGTNSDSVMKSLTIGNGLKNVGRDAFPHDNTLEYITVSAENENFYGTNCLVDNATDKLILGSLNAVLPEGLKEIGNYAFCSSNIQSILIPSTVVTIGVSAFYGCNKLNWTLVLPSSVKRIENGAFAHCAFTSISMSSGIEYVGPNAFVNATSLKVYNGVGYLGNEDNPYLVAISIYNDNSVTEVSFHEDVKVLCEDIFKNANVLETITIPDGVYLSEGLLKSHSVFETKEGNVVYCGTAQNPYYYVKSVEGSESTYTINSNAKIIWPAAFADHSNITSIEIPEGVERIDDYAFRATGISSIKIPSSVKKIGQYAFSSSSNLTTVTIDPGIEEIPYGMFWNCGNLQSVSIPGSVKVIGERAFEYCYNLSNVTIEEGVEEIQKEAFHSCYRIADITIPSTVVTIGERAFFNCQDIVTLVLPEGLKVVGKNAFDDCSKLETLTLPSTLESIGSNGFYGCSALKTIVNGIPAGIKSIGQTAFGYAKFNEINFAGTIRQFVGINIGHAWSVSNHEITIHCTDGDLTSFVTSY